MHRKNLALLAYLGRSPNRTRTRDQIVGVLWPDKDDQTARHSLRQAIRDIKAGLGDDVLVATSTDVALAEDHIAFDFDRFEQSRADTRWADAATLIRGDFLEGFAVTSASAFEDWLAHERTTWRRRSVEVLLVVAEERILAGDLVTAADHASRAVGLDPHSDAVAQVAIRCAALEGNPAGASEIYQGFQGRLAELGLEPTETTRALVGAVQRERHWDLPRMRAAEPTRRTPLIGRAAELTAAMDQWIDTRESGTARVVLIEGDQGTGKTRFAEEIAARTRLDGAQSAWIRSVEADEHVPWSGVAGVFTGGLLDVPGLAGAHPGDLSAVAAIVPDLRHRFSGVPGEPIPPPNLAVPRVIKAVCEEQPVVLVFDDAHHLDASSLEVVQTVARDLASLPLLMVLTMSPRSPRPEIEDLRSRMGREIRGTSVETSLFGHEEIAALAGFFIPHYTGAQLDRLTRRILLDSGGSPLLTVELLHAIAIGLELQEDEVTEWPQAGRTLEDTQPEELPSAVIGAIRASYWRAPEPARTVLLAVAAIDHRVSRQSIHRATRLPNSTLDKTLDWLEWERWLVSERRGYTYAARIVRDVVARDMLTPGQAERYREQVSANS